MKFSITTPLVFALALGFGCGSDGDSGAPDAEPGACVGATGCNGPCELGNELGVGRYCTKGGLQCADTPNRSAPFCTVDSADTDLAFCTRPCTKNEDCGTGAICESEDGSGPSGCVPVFCTDGMGDGGMPDAGATADAGAPDAN